MPDNGFPYGIGAEYNGTKVAEDGFDIVEIPAHTYAVFTCRGRNARRFQRDLPQDMHRSSRRIPLTNTEAAWSLRFILRATFRIPIIPARIWIAVKEKKN